jgi:hypothetical protein
MANKGKIGQTVQVAIGAVTGKGQAPGELRTITQAEASEHLDLQLFKSHITFRFRWWKDCIRNKNGRCTNTLSYLY